MEKVKLMKKYLLIAAALALTACGGKSIPPNTSTPPTSQIPNAPFNQQQTAKLIGNWTFNFEITSKYSFKYTLSDFDKTPNPDGNYNVYGEGEDGITVTANYLSQNSTFHLDEYTKEGDIHYVFVFTFDSANLIHGCARVVRGNSFISDCYAMTGTRTSATPMPLSLRH